MLMLSMPAAVMALRAVTVAASLSATPSVARFTYDWPLRFVSVLLVSAAVMFVKPAAMLVLPPVNAIPVIALVTDVLAAALSTRIWFTFVLALLANETTEIS